MSDRACYEFETVLREGSDAIVYRAIDCGTKRRVVIKYPTPNGVQTENEANVLSMVSGHPSIIGIINRMATRSGTALVLPFAEGGDLLEQILVSHAIDENRAKRTIHKMLDALAHMHSKGIWHRDVKPDNILITGPTYDGANVVLSDFGFSKKFAKGETCSHAVGTFEYAAPELLDRNSCYNEKADIWSLGVTMYVLLTGAMPYEGDTRQEIAVEIMNGLPHLGDGGLDDMSDEAIDLILRMLEKNPNERISAQQALFHPWFDTMTSVEEDQNLNEDWVRW